MEPITQSYLKEHFEYRKGHLWWIKKTSKKGPNKVGKKFGCLQGGYRVGVIKGKPYPEHRLIWLYHYGEWPAGMIDHINRIRNDNRIENLRVANYKENRLNSGANSGKIYSNYRGVSYSKRDKKWTSQATLNGKFYWLGSFKTEIEAAKAYDNFCVKNHGEFLNLNVGNE